MSRRIRAVFSVASFVLLAGSLPAHSAPLMPNALVAKSVAANANTLEVRFGGWGGWRGGWGGWRGGWGGWGWGGGVLAGTAIGVAIAAPYYYGGYDPYYYAAPYPYSYGYPAYYAGYYHPYGYWHRPYWANPYHNYGWRRAQYYW